MPLQIRRGTEAERLAMAIPLAEGELLYVTDDKRIYVGGKDAFGNPIVGGVQITGYTNEDAQDAAASMLANGTHSGIVFTYNDTANELSASLDLSTYTGTATAASFKGSLVADDSTILVDAVAGRIVGPVFSNVTGDVVGNVTGDVVGNVTGDVVGNVTGDVVGDLKGSVFGDDSSLLVNAIDSSFHTSSINIISNKISAYSDTLVIEHSNESGSALSIQHNMNSATQHYNVNGITDGSASVGVFTKVSKGSLASPVAVVPGDALSFTNIQHAYDGSGFTLSSGIASYVDQEGTVAAGAVPGKIVIATYADGATAKGVTINSKGWVSINSIGSPVGATLDINGFAKLAVLTSEPASPANGMVAIADGSSWNPTSTGKQTMVVRLGGTWIQMAVAA